VFFFHCCNAQLTAKAFAALLEGPFANSILELGDSFEDEEEGNCLPSKCLDGTRSGVDGHHLSLELMNTLKHQMMENRRKFPCVVYASKMTERVTTCYTNNKIRLLMNN
jgi:hypothetical protein